MVSQKSFIIFCGLATFAPRVPKNVKKCPERPKVPKMARKCPELPNLKKFYLKVFLGHTVEDFKASQLMHHCDI